MSETAESTNTGSGTKGWLDTLEDHYPWTVMVVAALIFLGAIVSPPSLMDDVDAAHATVARTMLRSGDWVTARLDGVVYLDKAPMTYWSAAAAYAIFGIHDWAARIPLAFGAVLLCWVTARFGAWAFGRRAGFYAGLALATCVGLFLFTRFLIPDVMLTLCVTAAFWSFLRLLEPEERNPRVWAILLGGSLGAGLLTKGLIALIVPAGGIFLYLLLTGQLLSGAVWKRLRPLTAVSVLLLVALPWYILATIQNPPYFDLTLRSEAGQFRGFFWRYFINEHLLRFLGLRHPPDYDTVPRAQFWLLNLVWLFPWSAYFPAAARLSFQPADRAGRTRLLGLCWTGFLLLFFTFSTTQEYYSMPVYPALALLLGSAMAQGGPWVRWGTRAAAALATAGALACLGVLWRVRSVPVAGDIASSLTQNPDAYTLSMGHLSDLTLESFAYLRMPLALAAMALAIGAVCAWIYEGRGAWAGLALMMVLGAHAARMALVVFDPHLSSRAMAEALLQGPPGQLIVHGEYSAFSSVFFYADREGLLLNGRFNNLEYGSHAPGAPAVFIDGERLKALWESGERQYLVAFGDDLARIMEMVRPEPLYVVRESGGKMLLTNRPLDEEEQEKQEKEEEKEEDLFDLQLRDGPG